MGMIREMPVPNGNTPAGDTEAAAGGMTDETVLPEDADNKEPAADETTEPATRKSVAGYTDEIAVQGPHGDRS